VATVVAILAGGLFVVRPTKKVRHGTVRGYKQELRRIEQGKRDRTCPACKAAWRVYYNRKHARFVEEREKEFEI